MTRAVLFDLFETLVTESAARPAGAASLGPSLGIDDKVFRAAWASRRADVVLGRLSFAAALVDIGLGVGHPVDRAAVKWARQTRVRVKSAPFASIDAEVLTALTSLRNRGLRLAVVSNCFAEDIAGWAGCPLAPMFDGRVFSFEVGLAKPDPAIYLKACDRLAVRADDTVFVGDGASDELDGARRAGLRACQAMWFLRRWPHFDATRADRRQLRAPGDLVRLMARLATPVR